MGRSAGDPEKLLEVDIYQGRGHFLQRCSHCESVHPAINNSVLPTYMQTTLINSLG